MFQSIAKFYLPLSLSQFWDPESPRILDLNLEDTQLCIDHDIMHVLSNTKGVKILQCHHSTHTVFLQCLCCFLVILKELMNVNNNIIIILFSESANPYHFVCVSS